MPLIECPDCYKQISDAAPACPSCGRPMTTAARAVKPSESVTGRKVTGFILTLVGAILSPASCFNGPNSWIGFVGIAAFLVGLMTFVSARLDQ